MTDRNHHSDGRTELVERYRKLPRVDHARIRKEADEFFGTEDRIDQDDPWERSRGNG